MDDVKSLAHSKWRGKYHIVFAPKYRRQVIYGKLKADVGKILRELCEWKGVEIIEAECCPDYIHKYKYGNRHFWCRGYYVDTVGKYEGTIKEYIQNQLQEDIINEQISFKELIDPFTGELVKQGK